MNRKYFGVLILIIFIFLLAFSIGAFKDYHGPLYQKNSVPIILFIVFSPILIAFLSNNSAEQPVNAIIYFCRKHERVQKFEAVRPYLSKQFLKSPKVLLLMQWHPEKAKSLRTEITEEQHRMLVHVILRNGQYYIFSVVKREAFVDPVGNTVWVIDDIEGEAF